jgi:hypothetical protein
MNSHWVLTPRISGSGIAFGGEVTYHHYQLFLISFEKEKYIDINIKIFLKITGIISNTLNTNKAQRDARIQLCNTLALPVALCGGETWAVKSEDKSRPTAAEMKFCENNLKIYM